MFFSVGSLSKKVFPPFLCLVVLAMAPKSKAQYIVNFSNFLQYQMNGYGPAGYIECGESGASGGDIAVCTYSQDFITMDKANSQNTSTSNQLEIYPGSGLNFGIVTEIQFDISGLNCQKQSPKGAPCAPPEVEIGLYNNSGSSFYLPKNGSYHFSYTGSVATGIKYAAFFVGTQNDVIVSNIQFTYTPNPPPAVIPAPPHECNLSGSIIEPFSRELRESVPIAGTPYALNYGTKRVAGRNAEAQVNIPVTSDSLQPGQTGETLTNIINGATTVTNFPAVPDLNSLFIWNGLDQNGIPINSAVLSSTVGISYNGDPPSSGITGYYKLLQFKAWVFGLGGWSIDPVHFFDYVTNTLYLGTGTSRNITAFTTNSDGTITVSADSGNEEYIFDSSGKHLRTINGLTGAVTLTVAYDSYGHILSLTDPYGNTTTIIRDGNGNITGIKSPFGLVTSISLDPNGYIANLINPNNEKYLMSYYDAGGLMKTFQRPAGVISTFVYDSSGYLQSDSSTSGNSSSFTNNSSPNASTQSTTVKTADGYSTTFYGYGPSSIMTFPDGTQKNNYDLESTSYGTHTALANRSYEYSFDPRIGNSATYVSEYGIVSYDLYGNLLFYREDFSSRSITPAKFTPFNYKTISTQTLVDNSLLYNSVYTSSTGKTVNTTPMSRTSNFVQDIHGKIISSQFANYKPLKFVYDGNGRVHQLTRGNRTSQVFYNSQGFVDYTLNALNQKTSFTYDGVGRILTETLPDKRVISFTYDLDGNLASVKPFKGKVSNIGNNGFDLISEYDPPQLGLPPAQTDTYYLYNNDEQLKEVDRPDGNKILFTYDPVKAHLNSISTPNGTDNLSYDPTSGALISMTSPDGISDTFTYAGQLIASDINNNGAGYSRVVDKFLRTSSDTVTGFSGATPMSVSYGFDNDNIITSAGDETLARDPVTGFLSGTTLGSVAESFSYDPSYGELSAHSVSVGGSLLISWTYGRDKLGRMSQIVETVGTSTNTYVYAYDPSGRLSGITLNGATLSMYKYDGNSNATSGLADGNTFSAQFNAQDQLENVNGVAYTYTKNGEVQTVVEGSNTIDSLTYDVFGALKSDVTDAATISYLTDGKNRRVAKFDDGTLTNQWVYDTSDRIVGELDGAGNLVSRFVYGSRSNSPDYMIRGGVEYKFILDYLGSIRYVVNTSSGQIVEQITYNEVGDKLTDTYSGFQPFAFAGCHFDPDTNLCRFGARDYDPYTGRWLSKDPLLFGGGSTNLYGYAMNDPINFIDPRGLAPGDPFPSPGEAAGDVINYINPTSISQNLEYGGYIYRNPNGQYVATNPINGGPAGVSLGNSPLGTVADYHTHGAYDPNYDNEHFSSADILGNALMGINGYLGTPGGSIQMNSGGSITGGLTCH